MFLTFCSPVTDAAFICTGLLSFRRFKGRFVRQGDGSPVGRNDQVGLDVSGHQNRLLGVVCTGCMTVAGSLCIHTSPPWINRRQTVHIDPLPDQRGEDTDVGFIRGDKRPFDGLVPGVQAQVESGPV